MFLLLSGDIVQPVLSISVSSLCIKLSDKLNDRSTNEFSFYHTLIKGGQEMLQRVIANPLDFLHHFFRRVLLRMPHSVLVQESVFSPFEEKVKIHLLLPVLIFFLFTFIKRAGNMLHIMPVADHFIPIHTIFDHTPSLIWRIELFQCRHLFVPPYYFFIMAT